MRLFAAIKISDECRHLIERFVSDIQKMPQFQRGTKWVKPENLHLTLKFFGEIGDDQADVLKKALLKSAEGQEKFHLELTGIGVFPGANRPRVLWIGVEGNVNQLKKCADAVEKETVESGFPKNDKPFSAHLTVARFSVPPPSSWKDALGKYGGFSFGKFGVEKISLVQSVLHSSGAEYQVLEEFAFVEN